MIMQFSMKEWLRCYDTVHDLGSQLKASQRTFDYDGKIIPAIHPLKKREQKAIEFNIRGLIQRSSGYLNHCGMPMPKPLWRYDKDDPTTHASSPEFKYQHLVGW